MEYLRVTQVSKFLGVGISTVWAWSKAGRMPKPFKLSERVTVWRKDEIEAFVESREKAHNKAA